MEIAIDLDTKQTLENLNEINFCLGTLRQNDSNLS